jgi:NAD(P)-dependent dehydrogenase (short-subunit alcohol dehydrogenase family)
MRLDGKVAIVSGAARGIGQACAERLALEGAAVLVTDVLDVQGEAVAEGIRRAGGKSAFQHLDVTDEKQWILAVSAAQSHFGGLNVLVNNAGIGRPAPITAMSYETWRLVLAINLDGPFLGMKHGIQLMRESGGGSIINISSAAGMKPYATMSAYCASKAALRHLTKVAALECGQAHDGIRVNSVHPGIVDTPAWDSLGGLEGRESRPDLDAMCRASVPLGYKAVPGDIAGVVVFLASEESRYMTGAELLVDGGQAIG